MIEFMQKKIAVTIADDNQDLMFQLRTPKGKVVWASK